MADTITKDQLDTQDVNPSFQEMLDRGVLYGRTKTKTHPRMKVHIDMNRNGIEILDLNAIQASLDTAKNFVKETVARGGTVLILATQPSAHEAALETMKEFQLPGVISRWLGGTFTNFKVIAKRIEHFKKLKVDRAQGVFQKYTKKEQLLIERDIKRLEEFFGNLEGLTALPQALIVVDTNLHTTAVREAHHLKIPMVAFLNTDADPKVVEYPVFGNNKSRGAITWFFDGLRSAIREGKAEAMKIKAEKEAAKNNEGSHT